MAKNAPTPTPELETDDTPIGKGRPTPTRREKEQARKRPLVSSDRSAARRQDRGASASDRERARAGLARGDEKFLPAKDKGPQKRFARDYIDARRNVGELLIPIMVVIIILTFIKVGGVQQIAMIVLYVFFASAVIDAIIAGTMINRKLAAKYGDRVERIRWYAAIRSFQLRPMRLPKPQVKRGEFPTL